MKQQPPTSFLKIIVLRTLLLFSLLFIACSKDSEEAPDTIPPTVNFSIKGITEVVTEEPPIIGNTIEIEIDAQDAKGISKVEAFLDNVKVGEDTTAPFNITIDLTLYANKLSGKGTQLNKTQTLYNLKVSATDEAGNISSVEQHIIVDNEKPTIADVSLINNTILRGEENEVTFKAADNEEITLLEVKINDVITTTAATDSTLYTVNINTSILEDGLNNLSIMALDQAANTITYNAPFIVDNTGPEITLEGLSENDSIVDENTIFSIIAEDAFSEVDSLKVFVNDSLVVGSDNDDVSLDFNPEDYNTGVNTLKISTKDTIGNETVKEVSFTIKRLLLKINVPSDFLNPSISKFYIFASENTGELLDIQPLDFNTSFIKLNTLTDISLDTDYTLTFAYLYSGVGETSILKSIQNIKRATLDNINLKTPESKSVSGSQTYEVSTMPTGSSITGEGTDYGSSYDPDTGFRIDNYILDYSPATSSEYYIYNRNSSNNNYSYQIIDKPISSEFSLVYEDFISDGVETRYYNSSAIQDRDKSSNLTIYGFSNATDFDNDIKHLIWSLGMGNNSILDGSGYRYSFNTNFDSYSYKATMENYRIEAIGEPLEYYTAPDWEIDYTYSSTDKTFTLTKNGTTHTIGKIMMDLVDGNSFYTWTILFDSQSTESVLLPQLPEELQSWNINTYYTSGDFNIEQIEVKKYNGLDTYTDFLQTVIKNNEFNPLKVSDKIESIFKTNIGTYSSRPDFSFYY